MEALMKKNMFPKYLFVFVLWFAVIGCGGVATAAPTPDKLGTVVAETLTSVSVIPTQVAATPIPATFTPIPVPASPTAEAIGTHYIYTSAQNVNLRVNPGKSFKVSRVLAQGTRLQLLGFAPGKQWLNVVNDEGVIGWVGIDFVTGGFDGPPPPIVNPKDVQIITGKVLDVNGEPVGGIGFAIVQGGQREDASTDGSGTFYAFLPTKFSGNWDVGFVSIACTSNAMNANCKCLGGACKPDPLSMTVTLPLSAPLNFVWK
jgi:hypothetical protein